MKIGYMRVSTEYQDHMLQEEALNRYGVDKIYRDTISGKSTSREGLDAALSQLQQGDSLIVWKLDRLGRSVMHLSALLQDFIKRDIQLVSITEGFDIRNPMGKFFAFMLASVAELERDNTALRTKTKLAVLKQQGKQLGPGYKEGPVHRTTLMRRARRNVDIGKVRVRRNKDGIAS